MILNIGSGNKPIVNGINYDLNPLNEHTKKLDLETDTLPHEDSSVDKIYAHHILEHLINLKHVMNECHRVLKPAGELGAEVPKFPHPDAIKDPTHVRFFVPETFKYFEYDTTTEMYGFSRWVIINLIELDHIIKVTMRPQK